MNVALTIVDMVVLGILLISGVIAWHRGFLKETLSVSAWLVAALSAVFVWPVTKPFARALLQPNLLADILALVGVFFILLIPISFISFRLSEMVRGSRAGPLDKSLGFVFGLGRGLLVVGLAYVIFSSLAAPKDHPKWMKEARLLPVVKGTADVIRSLSGKPPKRVKELPADDPPPKTEAAKGSGAKTAKRDVKPTGVPKSSPGGDNNEGGGTKPASYSASARRAMDQLVSTRSKPE
jgi:membrane protein required for colicin V production